MNRRIYLIAFCYISTYLLTLQINAQDASTTTLRTTTAESEMEVFDSSESYCFRFTWLGPEHGNSTWKNDQNLTCEGILDEGRNKEIPCSQPLVITHEGRPPDMDYLWNTYKMRVACRRTRGLSCVKYSYIFNQAVQNVTYMCTKVFAENEGQVRSGCYSQMVNGQRVELCVCESGTGSYRPCNAARKLSLTSVFMFLSVAVIYF